MPGLHSPADWTLTSTGIYFIDRTSATASIAFFDFASSKVTRRVPLSGNPSVWSGLFVSPDGSWLAYNQFGEGTSDLMLAEGFH